jgi:hypothetical protein
VAAVPGRRALEPGLADAVRGQLRDWFGHREDRWEVLRVDFVHHGQPLQRPPLHPRRAVSLGEGRYVCGDHRDTASIQGALFSGRRCGEQVVDDLSTEMVGRG